MSLPLLTSRLRHSRSAVCDEALSLIRQCAFREAHQSK